MGKGGKGKEKGVGEGGGRTEDEEGQEDDDQRECPKEKTHINKQYQDNKIKY